MRQFRRREDRVEVGRLEELAEEAPVQHHALVYLLLHAYTCGYNLGLYDTSRVRSAT